MKKRLSAMVCVLVLLSMLSVFTVACNKDAPGDTTPTAISITFNSNGGTGEMANLSATANQAVKLTANAFTKEGYTFAGWALTADGAMAFADGANYTMGTANATLFAVWTANDNTIIFNANGGVGKMANQTIMSDTTLALTPNAFTKTGYTFAGWATTATGEVVYADGANYAMSTSGATLYAKWTAFTYTINFNYDGAGSDTSVQTMQATYDKAFTCPMPTKTTYVFQGWYDGETQITDNLGASIATLTGENNKVFNLTAKWALQTEGMAISGTTLTQYTGTAQYVVIPDTVTSIGYKAFNECAGLKSVAIPTSLETIDYMAFYYCKNLTSVVFEKGSRLTSISGMAFYGASIKEFTLPASVTNLDGNGNGIPPFVFSNIEKFIVEEGNTTFYVDGNCLINRNTKTVIAGCKDSKIPTGGSVTSIGSSAFYMCYGLTEITIPDSVTKIGNNAFYNCKDLNSITIGSGVTSIEYGAFESCFKLTSITVAEGNTKYKGTGNCLVDTTTNTLILGCNNSVIPDGVKSIGNAAFFGYRGLKSIVIPSTVTILSESAFRACGLTSIIIPDSVTSIGNEAFLNCTGLKSITIGSGVKSIGNTIFFGCRELASITVAEGNTTYKSVGNCLIERATGTLIAGCQSSVIPTDGSVTKIGTGAFYACYGLTSFTIPSGVTSIGEDAFRNCTGLTSIIIPSSVTSIGKGAFYSCGWLTSITIPTTVATIGANAFNSCGSLKEINCGAADPTPEAQPTGWNANWKGNCTATVNWGYTGA